MKPDYDQELNIDYFLDRDNHRIDIVKRLTPIRNKEIARNLEQLFSGLNRFYSIQKGLLAVLNPVNDKIRITHMLRNRKICRSVTLVLKNKSSALYQVLQHGFPVVENYPDHFSKNILERKIIISDESKSVLIIPLIYNSTKMGVLAMSSTVENGFGIYLDSVGEGLVERFCEKLYNILYVRKTSLRSA